jgi:O-antigen/teichoic acid export membrane protein
MSTPSQERKPVVGSSGLARNAISNWLAFLYVAGVSFFLSPFIVYHLGATAYGVWALLVALVGYLGLLDFGVRGAVTRYIAHHHAVSDAQAASGIATAALVLFGCLGVLAIIFASVIAYFSPHWFNIPPELTSRAQLVIVVGGFTVASTLIGAVFGGIITGLQRFDISSGIEILLTTFRTIAVIYTLDRDHGLLALSFIHLAASMVYGVVAWRVTRRIFPQLKVRFDQPLRGPIKTILSFSAFLSIIHVLAMVIYYTDAIVIATVLPISAVASFAIASNLWDYSTKVSGALSKTMAPRVSQLTSLGASNVADDILSTSRLATLAMAPIAATFLIRGESFINLWMGPEYGPTSGAVLRVFAFMVWLGGARAVATSAIIGSGRHRSLIPAFIVEAVSNLGLSILLAHLMGIVGVALGTLIPAMLVGILFIPRCLRSATGVRIRDYFLKACVLPSIACVPFLLATLAFQKYMPASNLFVFFGQVLVSLPLVPLFAIRICATPQERAAILKGVRKLLGRAGIGADKPA